MISKWMRRVALAAMVAGTVAVAGASTAEAANRYGTRGGSRAYYGNTVRSYRPIVVNPGYGGYGYYPRAGVSVGVGPRYNYGYSNYGYSNFNRPYSSYYSPYSNSRSLPWGGYGVGGYPPGASWGGGGINLRIGR